MSAVGFPDFRRQVDYDTNPNLADFDRSIIPSGTIRGPYNLANWASIAGVLTVLGNPVNLSFAFYTSPTLLAYMGTRNIRIDPTVNSEIQFRLPALGRYCTFTPIASGGGNLDITGSILGTNRPTTNELTPRHATIVDSGIINVAAGGFVTAALIQHGSGRAIVGMETTGQPGNFVILYLNAAMGFDNLYVIKVAGGASGQQQIYIPNGTILARVYNTGGVADNYRVTVTLDTSG